MSWGEELWDQYDAVSQHTLKGIEFCDKYTHFLKERCSIEIEYAGKLKKLVKSYQPKKKDDPDNQYSCAKGFFSMLTELNDMAGQHESIVDDLQNMVMKELQSLVQEIKQDRKRLLEDGNRHQQSLQKSMGSLEKTKKQYEKAFREAEKASEQHKKAEDDQNLSRAEVARFKQVSHTKNQQCDESKSEYARQLQLTNDAQKEFYSQQMPAVFNQLQQMDEKRVKKVREFIEKCSEIEKKVIPIVQRCIDGMKEAGRGINAEEDSKLVISRFKSGYEPPGNHPFEDLSQGPMQTPANSTPVSSPAGAGSVGGSSMKGTGTLGKSKKSRPTIIKLFSSSKNEEVPEDFSHLPPNQRRKQLQEKINKINAQIAKENAEKNALLKMKGVYNENSKLGDPAVLDSKLQENKQKLETLFQELDKFQNYLHDAEGRPSNGSLTRTIQGNNGIHSTSDSSISIRAGDSFPNTPNLSQRQNDDDGDDDDDSFDADKDLPAPPPPPPSYGASQHHEDDVHSTDSFDELPILGSARGLYPFDGSSDGSIPISEGEAFCVVEKDKDDGWTRVRKSTGEEGYVPTSYVEITWHNH